MSVNTLFNVTDGFANRQSHPPANLARNSEQDVDDRGTRETTSATTVQLLLNAPSGTRLADSGRSSP